MKIAIAGAGIAGGYLARLLERRGIIPDLYGRKDPHTSCRCRSCGWGTTLRIGPYLEAIDLDLTEYLSGSMFSMNFDGLVAETPLCTINKPRLLRDITQGLRQHNQPLEPDKADDYDLLVDATGVDRALLPPCRADLTLPTLQHRIIVEPRGSEYLKAGVYGKRIPGLGYLWVFPLDHGQYHIGVGGIGLHQHAGIIEHFYREMSDRFAFTPVCSCTGSIRVASPYYSLPFSTVRTRADGTTQRIVGVGEAIGTVSPFTGEGIIYSLECARLLADSWPDERSYSSQVLAGFRWMRKERETLDYLLSRGRDNGPRLRDRWRFFRNAQRSGINLPMVEAFRRMGGLSRWVDCPDQ